MSSVGALPGGQIRRAAIRQMVNPMDKCTVFSIYPRLIKEHKCTLDPGLFIIEPGSPKKPTHLVVGPSSWWKDVDEHQPLLEIPQSSILVAQSIVRDYCNGVLGCNMHDKMPGLWFEEGAKDIPTKELLDLAIKKQNTWYQELVLIADTLWARTQGNPLSISDDARMAALELNLKDKAWLKDYHTVQLTNCPMCGTMRNPEYPMCPNCKAILDTDKAAKLGLKFAS